MGTATRSGRSSKRSRRRRNVARSECRDHLPLRNIGRPCGLLSNPDEILAREEVLVGDVMVPSVVQVTPDAGLREATRLLSDLHIRHLVVTDSDGSLVGVLSDRDLLNHYASLPAGSNGADAPVRSIMTRHVVTVGPDTPIQVAAETMVARKISCLPIVASGRLLGIVTTSDLLLALRILEISLKQAALDTMTGLYNRRVFMSRVQEELARCLRQPSALSILLLDLDGFKSLNDRFGHAVGDRALVQMVQCMKETLRECETVARYGGDEFAALLPQADLKQAESTAERICTAVRNISIDLTNGSIELSVSIGAVTLERATCIWNPERLLSLADQALYEAKSRGRDRTHTILADATIADG